MWDVLRVAPFQTLLFLGSPTVKPWGSKVRQPLAGRGLPVWTLWKIWTEFRRVLPRLHIAGACMGNPDCHTRPLVVWIHLPHFHQTVRHLLNVLLGYLQPKMPKQHS